jgi:hypothetical protein
MKRAGCLPIKLLPDTFSDQRIDFTVIYHVTHQLHGLWRDTEIETCRETCTAQDAHRVLAEGGADMAQHASRQIGLSVVRIYQRAVGILRDGVDGEVAARQVLLQRHICGGIHRETLVTPRGLALGTCQRVLLMRLGMQEYGKIFADWQIALHHHRFWRAAHYHPVMVVHRQPQQCIAHRPTDTIYFVVIFHRQVLVDFRVTGRR